MECFGCIGDSISDTQEHPLGNFLWFVGSLWLVLPLQPKPTWRHLGGVLSAPIRLLFRVLILCCGFDDSYCVFHDLGHHLRRPFVCLRHFCLLISSLGTGMDFEGLVRPPGDILRRLRHHLGWIGSRMGVISLGNAGRKCR